MKFSNEELKLIKKAIMSFKDDVKRETYEQPQESRRLMDERIMCDELLKKLQDI